MSIITEILKRPSQRTQMEATMAGLSILLMSSIVTPIYIIFFSQSAIWLKIVTGFGGIGLFFMMFSSLAMTYVQYHQFKLSMGLYSPSQKLLMKLEDAKQIKKELDKLIEQTKLEGGKKC